MASDKDEQAMAAFASSIAVTCVWIAYILYKRRRSSTQARMRALKRKQKQAAAIQHRTAPGADTDDQVRLRFVVHFSAETDVAGARDRHSAAFSYAAMFYGCVLSIAAGQRVPSCPNFLAA